MTGPRDFLREQVVGDTIGSTIAAEAGDPLPVPTVDWMLRHDQAQITRQLRQIADELGMSDVLFPRPIAERIHRRTGRALRRYRGEHRTGCWSVDALAAAVAAQADEAHARHRRSLRHHYDGRPKYLGTVLQNVQFYIPPGTLPDGVTTATFTFTPDDNIRTYLQALVGPLDPPDVDEPVTEPIPRAGWYGYQEMFDPPASPYTIASAMELRRDVPLEVTVRRWPPGEPRHASLDATERIGLDYQPGRHAKRTVIGIDTGSGAVATTIDGDGRARIWSGADGWGYLGVMSDEGIQYGRGGA